MKKIIFVFGIINFLNTIGSEDKKFRLSSGSAFKEDCTKDCQLSFDISRSHSSFVKSKKKPRLGILEEKRECEQERENDPIVSDKIHRYMIRTFRIATNVSGLPSLSKDKKAYFWHKYKEILIETDVEKSLYMRKYLYLEGLVYMQQYFEKQRFV